MSDRQSTVGWIGTGRMGAAMASRLARAGEDVTVWNRTRAKAEALADPGARSRTRSPTSAVTTSSSRWSRPRPTSSRCCSVRAACWSTRDRVPGAVVDCSTVYDETSEAMRAACAERGVGFLAAPVSGNGKVVAAGRLTLVVSGPRADLDEVAPLLDHLGKSATYVGRGRPRPAREDLPQPHARRRDPVPGGDHRAGREGRSAASGVPGVPEQLGDGLDVHPLQVARVRAPRLHADLHAAPAAQGLRPRPRRGPRARRPDAGRGRRRSSSCRPRSPPAASTRTSPSCSSCRPQLRTRARARGRRGGRRARQGGAAP